MKSEQLQLLTILQIKSDVARLSLDASKGYESSASSTATLTEENKSTVVLDSSSNSEESSTLSERR